MQTMQTFYLCLSNSAPFPEPAQNTWPLTLRPWVWEPVSPNRLSQGCVWSTLRHRADNWSLGFPRPVFFNLGSTDQHVRVSKCYLKWRFLGPRHTVALGSPEGGGGQKPASLTRATSHGDNWHLHTRSYIESRTACFDCRIGPLEMYFREGFLVWSLITWKGALAFEVWNFSICQHIPCWYAFFEEHTTALVPMKCEQNPKFLESTFWQVFRHSLV